MKAIYSKEEAAIRNKESKRRHYLRNREEIIEGSVERKRSQRKRNRVFVKEYKKSHPCYCGESYLNCLDFHHKDPSKKDKCINHMSKSPVSLDRLKKEVEKCLVVCSNCHNKLHYPDKDKAGHRGNGRRGRAYLYVWEIKKKSVCKCGEDHPSCLDFHHKEDKVKNISKMVRSGYSLEAIQAEIDKCEIVCSNCHRKIHGEEL